MSAVMTLMTVMAMSAMSFLVAMIMFVLFLWLNNVIHSNNDKVRKSTRVSSEHFFKFVKIEREKKTTNFITFVVLIQK